MAAITIEVPEDLAMRLQQAGFELAKPYLKRTQFIQPIYGRTAVERFLTLVG